jgi:hypothetical protein
VIAVARTAALFAWARRKKNAEEDNGWQEYHEEDSFDRVPAQKSGSGMIL